MKDALSLLVSYNKAADSEMYDVIAAAPPDLLSKPVGSYFDTLLGLLNHILVSELGWLTSLRDSNLEFPMLESSALAHDHPGWKQNLHGELGPLLEHQQQMDDLLITFVDAVPEEVWTGTVSTQRRRGPVELPLGPAIVHLMNHATHHRGGIAQILDEEGIENDYSNLIYQVLPR